MSELKVNKISPASGTAFALGDSGDTFTLPSGATIVNSGTATGFGGETAAVWCNFNGTGTIALRDHFNVSSLTDHGTGDYSVSFTSNFASVNYSAIGHSFGTGAVNWAHVVQPSQQSTTIAVGSLRLETGYSNGSTLVDITHVHIVIFGD